LGDSGSPILTKVVLDVLKPHKPSILELGEVLGSVDGVKTVNIVIREVDVETETIKVVLEGSGFKYKEIRDVMEKFGAKIHSVDEVVVEKR